MVKKAFSTDEGEKAARFFHRYLTHVEGEWAGHRFDLADWQDEIVRSLFGTLNPDGARQFRTALIGIPRKNGKTTLAAGMALKLLVADKEPAAQVYAVAADKEQARLSFKIATAMVNANRELSAVCKCYRNSIAVPHTGSELKVISAEAYTKHGLNPHGIVFDELHAQPDRELWDVLTTAQGARRQPLLVAITTAGYDRNSICFEQFDYGRQTSQGLIKDPTFFFRWWGAAEDADWTDEAVWQAANPNWPTAPKPEFIRSEFTKARALPARQNTFRNLYLNQWVQSSVRWIDLSLWDENAGLVVESELEGRPCFAALDVASTSDFTAAVYVFPMDDGSYQVVCRFFLPRSAVERRSALRPTLEAWERAGYLIVTDGDVADDATIVATIQRDRARFNMRSLAYDPWEARGIVNPLEDAGMVCVKTPQSMTRLSSPSKQLERLLGDRLLRHGGHPILRWMADNVVAKTDGDGRIKPDKKKSSEKIDGIVALVMAVGESFETPPESAAASYLEALAANQPAS